MLAALGGAFVPAAFPQEQRLTRKIPSSGESLPAIGLGTWQVFDVGSDAPSRLALKEVLKTLGTGLVDSSPMYGSSEAVTGDLVAELGMRERIFMATKVWTTGHAEGLRQMEDSFRKLRVKQMDLMQVHNLVDVEVQTKSILDMKQRGRVRYAGITHYAKSSYADIERLLATKRYDFLQINYSLGERESERRVLGKARDLGMAVIANRPFAEGALFRRVKGKPLPTWAAELGIASWAQYFLKWIVSHPAVTCAIPGTGRPEHMRDNVGAGLGPIPDAAQRRRMLDHFESL